MKRIDLFLMLTMAASAQVPYDRIRRAAAEPGHWLTYSGNYEAHRFSPLAQLTPANVARLKPAWVYQVQNRGGVETTPLVVDGVMYITEPPTVVSALDLRTGRRLWTWERTLPNDLQTIGFGRVNRGVAVLGNMVYVGTLDAHLIALDVRSGAVRWDAEVADYKAGHCITAAPLAIDGKIITGISGGEAGIRGFLDAYDAKTGKPCGRFWTIPGYGEPGNDTSHTPDSWKTGGGSTWVTGSYDSQLNLIYWGVGNPGPDWNGDPRPGDNLYTCSLLALDADTGRLRWYFQFTPHDTHDWDSNHVPILFDGKMGNRMRHLVAVANRNAFYYVLDRATGEFLAGRPYARQTWASGLDWHGRPILAPGMQTTEAGTLLYPNANGATVWFSPSYSPQTGLVYVAVREIGSVYFKRDIPFKVATFYAGGGENELPADDSWGAIRALDATTGEIRWEFKLHSPPW